MQVVALGGLRGAGTAHVRLPSQGAGALRGENGAVALSEHVWEELLHEIEQRVEGERQVIPGALGGQVSRGDEASVRGWCVVERVEVADLAADLLGQCGDGSGVGQVGADDVHSPASAGQVRG